MEGQTEREVDREEDGECGKTGKGAFVFTAEAGVCVQSLSISISLTQSLALC